MNGILSTFNKEVNRKRNMPFFDEFDSTCLAMIARAPDRNKDLIQELRGDARQVAIAMTDPDRVSNEELRKTAREFLLWASERATVPAT